jgi:hypothetical protein
MGRLLRGSAAAALAVAFFALMGYSAAQQPADPHSQAFDKCANACNDCEQICAACVTHCATLVSQGKKEHLETLQTCQDCAAHCRAAADIVARKGPFADLICTACAEACKRCGDACDKHKDDPMMKKCTEECRRCEKECREMLKHVGGRAAPPK